MSSLTCVGTTDVPPPVKNNTDRMNQVVRKRLLLGWRSVLWGILDMSRDHRHPTACQKQHRQNEPVGLVDIATGVEVLVMMDLGDM